MTDSSRLSLSRRWLSAGIAVLCGAGLLALLAAHARQGTNHRATGHVVIAGTTATLLPTPSPMLPSTATPALRVRVHTAPLWPVRSRSRPYAPRFTGSPALVGTRIAALSVPGVAVDPPTVTAIASETPPTVQQQATSTAVLPTVAASPTQTPVPVAYNTPMVSPTLLPPTPVVPQVAGVPVRLQIPAIRVDASVEQVGIINGFMDTPKRWWDVGWLRDNPVPGDVGSAVIDGHLDTATGTAVFWTLGLLQPGNQFVVTYSSGQSRTFEVTGVRKYTVATAPLDAIFGPTTERHLNLITCAGVWDQARHTYNSRLVVYSRLIVPAT